MASFAEASAWLQLAREGRLDDRVFGRGLSSNQWLELRILHREAALLLREYRP